MSRGEIFMIWVERPAFFLSIFKCFGTACNFSTMFKTHSSNECVLYLLYDLFCDEPVSFCVNFLLQFSFSKVSDTSGLFSSKIRPCCNLSKCYSHSVIAVFVFLCICVNWEINCVNRCQKLLFIGLLLCLIMSSNCSTFCIGNFYVVRNPFAIAFLYTNIWIVCGVIFCFFTPGFICAFMFFFHWLPRTTKFFVFFFNLKLVNFKNPCFDSMLTCWIILLPILIHSLSKYPVIRLANDIDMTFSVFCVINAGISDFPILTIITAVTGVSVG